MSVITNIEDLRLLAKRPEDRFQTAEELLEDLDSVGLFQGLTD